MVGALPKVCNAAYSSAIQQSKVNDVLFVKVRHKTNGVQEAVKTALKPMWENRLLRGNRIFVKVNLISSEFVLGSKLRLWCWMMRAQKMVET